MKHYHYRNCGVDEPKVAQWLDNLAAQQNSNTKSRVLSAIGGFAACYELPIEHYQQPLLVSCTDGVGTKLRLAKRSTDFINLGQDLVAMCVNDLITTGAQPLTFLDYYASATFNEEQANAVLKWIIKACEICEMTLVGGETAQLPNHFQNNAFELVGFCNGIVEKSQRIDGSQIQTGDQIIAIESSGLHANGYALIHALLNDQCLSLNDLLQGKSISDYLLTPTLLYAPIIKIIMQALRPHAMAHITGGGLEYNINRVIPKPLRAQIDIHSWTLPPLFQTIQHAANLDEQELRTCLNCGIGYVIIIDKANSSLALDLICKQGLRAWLCGVVSI